MKELAEILKYQKYSIVIASIGRACLHKTLEDILCSSQLPDEVIIVLPHSSDFVLCKQHIECDVNICILHAAKGQVKQRQVGLRNCTSDIIIQLDDDMRFENTLLECLVYEVFKNPSIIVSPVIYDHNLDCKTGVEVGKSKFLRFLFCANSEKEALGVGYVSAIGLAIRPSSLKSRDLIRSDWLPGGCMSYNKKFSTMDSDIVSPDGKFFGEDLVNSHIMKEKGAVLFFAAKLSVRTEFASVVALNNVISHFKSMVFIQKITHSEIFYVRTVLFCLIRCLYLLLPKGG